MECDDDETTVVVEDPVQPGVLYVGTNLGVYVSLDDGVTWLSLGVPGRSRGEYLESIARFGDEVIG